VCATSLLDAEESRKKCIEKTVGHMSQNTRRKGVKLKLSEPEEVEEQIMLRLSRLMIKEMEFDHKMRDKALHLSRKRKKQVDSWVI
jgi:hypothetical protein